MDEPSPIVFPAVFSVLHERLQRQIDAPNGKIAEETRLNRPVVDDSAPAGSTALLAYIAALEQIPPSSLMTVSVSANTLSDRRKNLYLRRKRLEDRVRRTQCALASAHRYQQQQVDTTTDGFKNHVETAHANAKRRLQALCVECITEIHKALDRKRNAMASLDTTDHHDVHAQTDTLKATLQWQRFLARLHEDTQGDLLSAILLYATRDSSSMDMSQVVADLGRLIAMNGPVLSNHEVVVIDRVVAIADRQTMNSSPEEPRGSRTASLHFMDSMTAAWTNITTSFRLSSKPSKQRRSATSNGSVLFSFSGVDESSSLRRIIASHDTRMPNYLLDTPLSCSGIYWLLHSTIAQIEKHTVSHCRLRDSDIYVAAQEWSGGLAQDVSPHSSSEITQRVRQRYEDFRDLTVSANDGIARSLRRDVLQQSDGSVFVRATLLELVLTSYARNQFLALLERDIEHDESVCVGCAVSLVGAPIISTLYVAEESTQQGTVRMMPLNAACLHELCVLYVARGICTKQATRRTVVSLARADAFSILPLAKPEKAKFCVVRKSPSLIRSTDCLQRYPWLGVRSILFVEYHVEKISAGLKDDGNATTNELVTKKRQILQLLGPRCSWRSCLDAQTKSTPSNGLPLCDWHRSIQSSMSDATHFLPNLKELKACVKPVEEQRQVETIKKVLIKSSSLLEELTSRQLTESIAAFLQHAYLALSNSDFIANQRRHDEEAGACAGESGSDSDIEDAVLAQRACLETLHELLTVQQSITETLQVAIHNGRVLPIDSDSEWNDLDGDIRTDNHDLLLELSRRKLSFLQGRQRENSVVPTRLTHSQSDGAVGGAGLRRYDGRLRARQQTRPKSSTYCSKG